MFGELRVFFLFFFFIFFFLPGYVGVFVAHFHKCFVVRSVLGDKLSVVEQVPSFLKIGHQDTAQEEDQ